MSPAGPLEAVPGGVTAARGFLAGSAVAGLRSAPRLDVALLATDGAPASAAATFTTNRFRAAPVEVAIEALERSGGQVRGLVVNAGCANAGTGTAGLDDARRMASAAAHRLGCRPEEVLPASTGLIGSRLAVDRIEAALPGISLRRSARAAGDAARAIMTTDTLPKQAAVRAAPGADRSWTVGGMAKGSGMIHPQMATMLAFLTTDAPIRPPLLGELLRAAVERTFNQVSVDGDGSTNDAVIALAGGAAGGEPVAAGSPGAVALGEALEAVCRSLAQQIAADGEGATRRIDVVVGGARDDAQARAVARAVAASNLVKSAVHGADPNWGRIAAAAGRSGAELDPGRLRILIGDQEVFAGSPCPFNEAAARAVLRRRVVTLRLDLALGEGEGEAWGCDLSAEYVAINSEYPT